jgi:hypothetical protein
MVFSVTCFNFTHIIVAFQKIKSSICCSNSFDDLVFQKIGMEKIIARIRGSIRCSIFHEIHEIRLIRKG